MIITMMMVMVRKMRLRLMKMNIMMMTRMSPSTLTLSNEVEDVASYENNDDNRALNINPKGLMQ